ncbi:MAG: hypothetical protein QXU18_10980 [Thermoplasmatales archaeon]
MDLLLLLGLIILGDGTVMGIMVLLLNPKLSSKSVKKALLEDSEFFDQVLDRLLEKPEKFEPLEEKFRQKLMGTISGQQNVEKIAEKVLDNAVLDSMKESDPNLDLFMTALKEFNPRLYKIASANPALIPKMIRKYGHLLGIGDNEDLNNGVQY